MIRLLVDTRDLELGTDFGLGIDENTALVVVTSAEDLSVMGEVIGENGVYFVDTRSANVGETNGYLKKPDQS